MESACTLPKLVAYTAVVFGCGLDQHCCEFRQCGTEMLNRVAPHAWALTSASFGSQNVFHLGRRNLAHLTRFKASNDQCLIVLRPSASDKSVDVRENDFADLVRRLIPVPFDCGY